MSSTSRGGKRSPADFYKTPVFCVHRFIERVQLPGGQWFEPCAGDGAIIRAVNQKRSDVHWVANELREECRSQLEPLAVTRIGSFLELPPPVIHRPKVSVTNVPFSLAMEMILHSLGFSDYVVHLLRLNFLGTENRNEFFKSNMPDVYVIPDRVSFAISVSCSNKECEYAEIIVLDAEPHRKCPTCGAKTRISTTDSIEYAWFVWGPERGRRVGKIEVLDHTPSEERK